MIDNSNEGYLLKVADNLKLIPIAGVFPIENTGAEFFEKGTERSRSILPRKEESGLMGRFLGLFFST